MKCVISVLGKDRSGIVAAVSVALAECGANIDDISQTILGDMFSMTMLTTLDTEKADFNAVGRSLKGSLLSWACRSPSSARMFSSSCTRFSSRIGSCCLCEQGRKPNRLHISRRTTARSRRLRAFLRTAIIGNRDPSDDQGEVE